MKKILFSILMFFPLLSVAQNSWENSQAETKQKNEQKAERRSLFEKKNKAVDAKYLKEACPRLTAKWCSRSTRTCRV